jgi:hypothetical protein
LWYAEKVLGIKQERDPNSGASKGGRLHKQPENWYKFGEEPTHEGFLAARPGLPGRNKANRIEEGLEEPTLFVDDIKLEGYSDAIIPPELRPDGIPYVLDWKFGSSFRYMEDPANDLQCLIYGYWCSRRWPDIKEVRLGLYYFLQDDTTDFKPRVKVVPVERCESEWETVVIPTVQRMQTFVAKGHEEGWDLERTPDTRGDACYMYGSCHLMERCGIVPKGKADRAVRNALKDFDSGL